MTTAQLHIHFLKSKGICTDTRKLIEGQVYFALKGTNFNGNKFAQQALNSGASFAIVDEDTFKSPNTILVKDVLTTLQELATYHRVYLGIPIIGLTGSNGKTTTKELINSVLTQKYVTTATVGNLNNHIGVPLTLLSMTKETEIGIVEMGANHQKEIASLCSIARPDYGYITNFGKAHLEGFGGFEGVIKGKSELYDFLRLTRGKAILNDLDPLQLQQAQDIESFTFGSDKSDLKISLTTTLPSLKIQVDQLEITSNLIGTYNFTNISAAIAVGTLLEVDFNTIKIGIEQYIPKNSRSQLIQKNGFSIILDAYNANPTSMTAAIENLSLQKGHKVAFLGDMFEVGETSPKEHQVILDLLNNLHIETVFAVGPTFGTVKPHKNQRVYNTFESFEHDFLNDIPVDDAIVLIKGSRGMKMERVLDLIK